MIDYLEIRGADLNIIGIVDVFNSVIWHSVFSGVGDFEIYAPATAAHIELLKADAYVTRPGNVEVGIIESVNITYSDQDGLMIIATGSFAKSILNRRHIYNLAGSTNTATILRGNVEENVRRLVYDNAIVCAFDSNRNIPVLDLGDLANIPLQIVDDAGNAAEKQVSFDNLLEYTDGVLEEYGIAARCVLGSGKLLYTIYAGTDRSKDNAGGVLPIIFSREFDNLSESDYLYDTREQKNAALIGGAGEGIERYYSIIGTQHKGLQRRETFVDASRVSKTYKDDTNTEQTYTDAEYKSMLDTEGRQELSQRNLIESFSGAIDVSNGNYIYGRDFQLGDFVTVQDKKVNKYMRVRITEATEVQDESGYTLDVMYQ